jgi:hypothetical protein
MIPWPLPLSRISHAVYTAVDKHAAARGPWGRDTDLRITGEQTVATKLDTIGRHIAGRLNRTIPPEWITTRAINKTQEIARVIETTSPVRAGLAQ